MNPVRLIQIARYYRVVISLTAADYLLLQSSWLKNVCARLTLVAPAR